MNIFRTTSLLILVLALSPVVAHIQLSCRLALVKTGQLN